MLNLTDSIEKVPKVGPILQKRLNKLGIETIFDLLLYLPQKYQDFSEITPIKDIKENKVYCVCGQIKKTSTTRTYQKKMFLTEIILEDKSGQIKAVWFRRPYLSKTLKEGENICLVGKATFPAQQQLVCGASDKKGIYFSNPSYERVWPNKDLTHTGRLVPTYRETRGISSRWLRFVIKTLLNEFKNKVPETLPQEVLKTENLLEINQAIEQAHFPKTLVLAEKAKERFSFEQLFLIGLAVLKQRLKNKKQVSPQIPFDEKTAKEFVESLPFKLTTAQRKCAFQILKDIERPCPMSRLLQGDVGSGKTVVAIMGILMANKSGQQSALMAPTEILAKQHFKETAKLLQNYKIKIALLTSKSDKIMGVKLKNTILEISRKKLLEKTKQGEIDLLVGTHSLIQKQVKFKNLGLAVVDEQHRFGIKQRANLLAENQLIPHLLSMTATPIPRTLALTVYGDLDLSIIDEMPKGRKEIITKVIAPDKRQETYEFIKKEAKKGNQTFIVCPKIEETETENPLWATAKSVKAEFERLKKDIFPDLRLAMLHGKMKTREKEKTMADFRRKKYDILVSTSVIEVGIDIPSAVIILIEAAEHFGLAQLHQFRGRVGRSDKQSYCFLCTESKSRKVFSRLRALEKIKSGFKLAEKDLLFRGPGSLAGAKQWGLPDLAMDNLTNLKLVEKTRQRAKELLTKNPNLSKHPCLAKAVKQFEKNLHLE